MGKRSKKGMEPNPSPAPLQGCSLERVETEEEIHDFIDLNQYPSVDHNETNNSSDSPLEETDISNLDREERPKKKINNLNNDERHEIYDALLQRSDNGKLKRDTTRIVANMFSVSTRTVQRIWKMAKDNTVNGVVDVSHRRRKNCGRRRIQVDLDRIREIPLKRRTTLESMACALDTSKTSLFRLLKSGVLRRHTNPIKSDLTEEMFISMHNIVHNDEKCYYLTRRSEKYYLVWDEEDPFRTLQI